MQQTFEHVAKYLVGKGIDVGCGSNRFSDNVLAIDQQGDKRFSAADIVHDCKDLEIKEPLEFKGHVYSFQDNELDFIFSSHCLEDFENIPDVFMAWWKKIKPNGLMILLLPDMEGGRYPKVGAPTGNPSHKTNVGKEYITNMLASLPIKFEMIQSDTIDHGSSCTIDFVIKKL